MKVTVRTLPAFSIIEVLIGIFIFSLGLVSIYALLSSSLNINEYNKNAIIASNLSREQIELFRNIRDSNYAKLQVWDQINPQQTYDAGKLFQAGNYYTLENNFNSSEFPVKTEKIIFTGDIEGPTELLGNMQAYKLCLNSEGLYTYDCTTSGNQDTVFYRYLYIEQAENKDTGVSLGNAFIIKSKVIWYKRGYHEYEIQTIVTDWRRI